MNGQSVELYYREYGDPQAPPLLLLHGLFGAGVNWQAVVKQLQDRFRMILPDLRNHGRSPHHPVMDYPSLAGDVLALMDRLQLPSASLVGHSMGGKTAMWLALRQPERVDRLVVGDIAPVIYEQRFGHIFQGMQSVPLDTLQSREAADQYLARHITDRAVRQYLLQNLIKVNGGWAWRFALSVLQQSGPALAGFPDTDDASFAGKTLFLYGERSDYVKPEYRGAIERYFPHARLRMLNGTGHWLYAEQPEAFAQVVKGFLC